MSADSISSGSSDGPTAAGSVRSPELLRWLLVAVVVFFAVSFALSWLRAYEFQTTTWDQGLYQQAIWSTAHGRPFYETADVETGGYGSLLQVHSVFLFYLLVPIYAALPDPATLFAVQSSVVALAAVPLYFLARDVSHSPRLGLVAGLAYLAWTPLMSSILYDFHPEAFLPVELFALAALWERGRYRWGFAVAALSFTTFELAPVLVFFVGVYGLIAPAVVAGSRSISDHPSGRGRFLVERLRRWIGNPRVRTSFGLLLASVAAYAVLLYLRVEYLTSILGTYPLPQAASGYVIGATPSALGLSLSYLSIGGEAKLAYWFVAVALLAFVPFFAPRTLVLTVPWFAFTLLSPDLNYTVLGFQYGFIAASSLLVAFAYGLPRVRELAGRLGARVRPGAARKGLLRVLLPGARGRRVVLVMAFAGLLALNLALTPLDPILQNHGMGSAYRLSYTPSPDDVDVERLAAIIPANASLVASDNLFPLVANDLNAYSLFWTANPKLALPFNASHLPPFVFLSGERAYAVPPWLSLAVANGSVYGARGFVRTSDAGPVQLYEVGYVGPPFLPGT